MDYSTQKFKNMSIGIAVLLIAIAVFYALVIKKEKVDPSLPTKEDIEAEQTCIKYSETLEAELLKTECKNLSKAEKCQLPREKIQSILTQKEAGFNRCLVELIKVQTK